MRAEAAAFVFPRGSHPRADAMSFREGEAASRPWRSSREARDKPVQLVDDGDHVMGAASAPVWMTNGGCGGDYHCRQCQMGVSMRALCRGTGPICYTRRRVRW